MLASRTVGGALLSWKMRAFLSFQIVQEVSMERVAMVFLFGMVESESPIHHSSVDRARCQAEVLMFLSWSQSFIISQSLVVYRHLKRRWSMDSYPRLQRGQSPQLGHPRLQRGQSLQLGHPRLVKRSAFQTLFCMANHAKNLTLGGARAFHTASSMGERMMPKNWAK